MNDKNNHLENIRNRILQTKPGTLFIPSDFKDLAELKIVNSTLSRLSNDKTIRRIMRGIYEYPEYSDFLGEFVAPSPDRIAHTIARNNSWTIAPSGNTALNLLGLSTQVPATWEYVSNGKYVEYKYDSVTISFKKTTNKHISKLSDKTALVIQAIKALEKENVTPQIIKKLSKILTPIEKEKLLCEGQYTTSWIFEVIKKICNGGTGDESHSKASPKGTGGIIQEYSQQDGYQ